MDIVMSLFKGVFGIIVLIAILYVFSNNKKNIRWRMIISALIINVLLINFMLHTQIGQTIFTYVADFVIKFLNYSTYGAKFVFGPVYDKAPFAFIFVALVPLIFVGAVMGILYHFKIIQKLLRFMSLILEKLLGLSALESFGICSNAVFGQTETAVTVGPYLSKMTKSELFMIMTSGMACVAGTLLYAYYSMGANLVYVLSASIISIPNSVIAAKILFPESRNSKGVSRDEIGELSIGTKNVFEAVFHGANSGWNVALGVGVMLIATIPLIYGLETFISIITFQYTTLDKIFEFIFTPIAFLAGVPKGDINIFAMLFGKKTIFNEFIAFAELAKVKAQLSPKGFLMVCFGLTGFANLSSIGLQIGGFSAAYKGCKHRVAKFGLKALLGAIIANLLNVTVAGMFFY